jgi:O-antigen/teichoic acid export membrane protein
MAMDTGVVEPVAKKDDKHTVAGALRSGMLWNLLNFVVSQAAGILIFLILASRLPPEIFGLVALATVVADIVQTEGRYSGMDSILQTRRFDAGSLDGAFWAFMAVCFVFSLGLLASAPVMASVYDSPLLAMFIPVFAAMLLTTPWLSVMDALMMRDLLFREMTHRNILCTLIAGAAGIACAFSPFLVWALVAQRVVTVIVSLVFMYRFTRWRPTLTFDLAPMREFWARLAPLWTVQMLSAAMVRISTVLFGLRYDATTVGLLRAANRLTEAVQGPIISPLFGLWFPLMSKVRGDLAKEREVYLSILRTAAFAALPAFTGLIVITDDLVHVFLPEAYQGAADMMRAVCITSLLIPIAWFNPIAMNALDMNRPALIYMCISVVAGTTALLAFPNVSPATAILIMSAPTVVYGIGGAVFINGRLQLSNLVHFMGLAPAAIASLVMGVSAFALHAALSEWEPLWRAIAVAAAGAVIYPAWLMAFHRKWTLDRVRLLRGRAATDV